MTVENNLENKARFNYLYYGQKVMYVGGVGLVEIGKGAWNVKHPDFFLELKSLSAISDEDARDVGKIFLKATGAPYGSEFSKNDTLEMLKECGYLPFQVSDFLRSKSYALSWMGISVEQQIEFGWIRLK